MESDSEATTLWSCGGSSSFESAEPDVCSWRGQDDTVSRSRTRAVVRRKKEEELEATEIREVATRSAERTAPDRTRRLTDSHTLACIACILCDEAKSPPSTSTIVPISSSPSTSVPSPRRSRRRRPPRSTSSISSSPSSHRCRRSIRCSTTSSFKLR